jgi:hypothetical protein
LYYNILGRSGSLTEVNGWVAALEQSVQPLTRADVVQAFLFSDEHLNGQVQGYYRTFLHRTAQLSELVGWVSALRGGATEASVVSGFVSSAEYRSLHLTTDAFVTALYTDILGRSPDASELTPWINQVNALAQQYGDSVARSILGSVFATSGEAQARAVESFYETFLLRSASPQEQTGWLSLLRSGARYVDVAAGFLTSPEYFANATQAMS